jgi:hypothetical protein
MRGLLWLVVICALAGVVWTIVRWRKGWVERKQAAEARLASFVAQSAPLMPTPTLSAVPVVAPQERLLLEAALKAGEAGEAVLSIQLYAKLLSRYPQTQFAAQARAAVQAQKKKIGQA